MQLVIKIENNQPVDHPIMFDNFLMVYPGTDYNNLPAGYAKFVRVERPTVGVFQTVSTTPEYVWDNDVVTDYWEVTDMTQEQKDALIAEALNNKPFPSWSFDPETLIFSPPTPYPEDGKFYQWNEDTLSWDEVAIEP